MIEKDVDLSRNNTLALPARAAFFAAPDDLDALAAVLAKARDEQWRVFVIGHGSNVIMNPEIPGLVIQPRLRGIHYDHESNETVSVEAGAGESWDALVADTVARQLHGLENLSLIPGTVGAAPLQNIGAYGVELCDVLDSVVAMHIHSGEIRRFSLHECDFSYRNSFFRSKAPGEWLILRLRLRLHRQAPFRLDYADLQARFDRLRAVDRNLAGVRQMICDVRREKLPDVTRLPNAGSFFHNPIVSATVWQKLCQMAPDVVGMPQADGRWKVAAAWLIEHCGWKGRRLGAVGMHERQALVMINYGGASAGDVSALAHAVNASVMERFGIALDIEPVSMP